MILLLTEIGYSYFINISLFAFCRGAKLVENSNNGNNNDREQQEGYAYGSIALLDQIVEITDPIHYLRYGMS